jgi:hypothetical protein
VLCFPHMNKRISVLYILARVARYLQQRSRRHTRPCRRLWCRGFAMRERSGASAPDKPISSATALSHRAPCKPHRHSHLTHGHAVRLLPVSLACFPAPALEPRATPFWIPGGGAASPYIPQAHTCRALLPESRYSSPCHLTQVQARG